VFADVDPDNGLMTAASLEDAFTRADAAGLSVKALFPVHLAGQCPELAAIAAIARERGAAIVEDACHALGTYHACPDGSAAPVGACRLTDMAVFSFHPVKTIACGEGGAVTTNDPAMARRMARLRSHGMYREADEIRHPELGLGADGAANPWYYEMAEIGWNYRLSDIHAALAASQLAKLDHFIEERRALAQRYDDMLAPLGRLAAPIRRSRGCLPAWHLYVVLVDFEALGVTRADLMTELKEAGIGTQVHYIPVHCQPYYRDRAPDLQLAGAEEYYRRTLSLPLFVGMMPADVRRVVGALHAALLRPSARAAS
jgi:dTDP-4-amino-4,6-dideoxygalactose transaminase